MKIQDADNAARSLPHGRVLLDGLAVTFERLRSSSKVAVSLPLLRTIISVAVSELPFDPGFYLSTYADIREAYEAGRITDLRQIWGRTRFRRPVLPRNVP
jgi:hypothetical protein